MQRIPRAFLCGWLVWLAAGLCFAALYRPPSGALADFGSLYGAGYLAVHHPSELYSLAAQQAVQQAAEPSVTGVLPFVHLSYEALFYAPYTLLRYRAAYAACIVVNLLLLMASFLAAPELFSRVIPVWQPRPGLAIFLFFPVVCALIQGQDSLLLLLVCCLTLRSLAGGHDARAGAILALALFKFQLALPLFLLLVAWRGWRVAAGFVPVGALLVAGSAVLAGGGSPSALKALLLACLHPDKAGGPAQASMFIDPSRMPNLAGVVFTALSNWAPERVCLGLVGLLSCAVMVWGVVRMRRIGDEPADAAEAFGLAILCTVLVSYHLYLHDATLLLIPLAMSAGRIAGSMLLTAPPVLFVWAPHLLCLLALPMLWLLVDTHHPVRTAKPEWLHRRLPLRA